MRSPRALIALLAVTAALVGAGCGSDGADSSPAPTTASDGSADLAGASVDEAIESQVPTETVEVPSEDGATTVAEYAAGGSGYEPADERELASILAIVGTQADGYLTDDAVVVRTTKADAAVWCLTFERLDLSSYTVVPVLPDGTGVAC
jgi:hypothetical protein